MLINFNNLRGDNVMINVITDKNNHIHTRYFDTYNTLSDASDKKCLDLKDRGVEFLFGVGAITVLPIAIVVRTAFSLIGSLFQLLFARHLEIFQLP